jgi:chemotaxis methyl-accepting protein methylase
MRNPPLLSALGRVVSDWPSGAELRVASVACSTGAELYSALFVLRSLRPDLDVLGLGIDLSEGVVGAARRGVYSRVDPASREGTFDPGPSELADHVTGAPRGWEEGLFVEENGLLHVRDWVRRGTTWMVADAADPQLLDLAGLQDIVFANNFLGPMGDQDAERCLRNVVRLVRPGGVIVLEGVDLDLKVRVLASLDAVPVLDRLRAIYEADESKRGWPWVRWAHEPIDETRPDWALRYGTVYVLGHATG